MQGGIPKVAVVEYYSSPLHRPGGHDLRWDIPWGMQVRELQSQVARLHSNLERNEAERQHLVYQLEVAECGGRQREEESRAREREMKMWQGM